jgi:hypothetical protein
VERLKKFIICYGRTEEIAVIEADNLEAARQEAADRSVAEGMLDDELECWAELYTPEAARLYDLAYLAI